MLTIRAPCSLRYHLLHPEYIHTRISNVGQAYTLRLVIVQCDVENHQAAIRELTKVCIVNEYTMLVAWRCAHFSICWLSVGIANLLFVSVAAHKKSVVTSRSTSRLNANLPI